MRAYSATKIAADALKKIHKILNFQNFTRAEISNILGLFFLIVDYSSLYFYPEDESLLIISMCVLGTFARDFMASSKKCK